MPQNTNLNVSPYFDDFNEDKNYHKVLFKPGTAIQARELTTLQTILQNQIERFGSYMFKEGSKVIPGQTGYDPRFDYVQIDPTFFGISVSNYTDKLIGKIIQGETSGVTATVVKVITDQESDRNNNTLYIRYINSSNSDFQTSTFLDGERLLTQSDIEYGLSIIKANNSFAVCISENSTGRGSAAFIEEGIYFIRGYFVKVQSSTILLDQYGDKPSYRIGLLISEEIVTSFDDPGLNDNSQGFSNYAAPGADRFKIYTTFIKKPVDEFNDENFIELMRVQDGILLKFVKDSELNIIRDELAKRTYDESGDYYIKPFEVFIKESLNNFDFNNGIYKENEITAQGNIPSEDLYTLQISPGKAYVKGYEIEKISSTYLDVRKPEVSKTIDVYNLPFRAGNKVLLNNISGSPSVGFGTIATLSLRNERVGIASLTAAGNEIGKARCYDFKVKDASYTGDTTEFEVFLYDIDTFTQVSIGSSITLAPPALIQGNSSGSKGYLNATVNNGRILTLNSVSGSFIAGESISVNGISSAPTISSITDYSISDVKSIFSSVGVNTFSSDVMLTGIIKLGDENLTISAQSAGVSTVTAPVTSRFASGLKVDDIISYTRPGFATETFNRITAINSDLNTITVTGVTTVAGVCDGQVPTSQVSVPVKVRLSELTDNDKSAFYEPLPNVNISNIVLDNSQLVYRKSYSASVISNGCVIIEPDVDSIFEPFDEEKYILSYSDGNIEPLSEGKFSISANGKTLTLSQLSKATDANAKLVATLRKIKVDSKSKVLNRCATLTINKSNNPASGSNANTSLNDGLTYSSVYGLRVQDKEISLGKAEVLRIHGVFESDDSNDPTLPSLTLKNIDGNLLQSAIGDQITGNSSYAIGRVVSVTSDTITFVYNNDREFQLGESITLKLSQIVGTISSIVVGDKKIDSSFILDSGERLEFLDFGRIIRKDSAPVPSRRLTLVYDYYSTPTSDTGEFFSYLSWPPRIVHDGIDLPRIQYDTLRHSDVIDFRPRVADYTNTNYSPFQYESRIFPNNGSSVTATPVSGESLVLGYSYRLPRADVLVLTKEGEFKVISGEPSDNPVPPVVTDGSFEVGSFVLKPYAYLARSDIQFNKTKHKRYQMKDIGKLEDRIQNIEYYTQLSLLEMDTQNLSIKDPVTGLDRFKNGIFVDNFRSHDSHNMHSPDFKASIDIANGELRPSHYTTSIDLLIGSASAIGIGTTANTSTDLRFVTDLQNANIQKTGDLITLKYNEETFIEQKFATRVENVNPFAVLNWFGGLELNPETDTWVEEKMLDPVTLNQQGNYDAFMSAFQVDPNTGLSPVDWGAWEEVWSGKTLIKEFNQRVEIGTVPKSSELVSIQTVPGGPHRAARRVTTFRDTFVDTYLQEVKVDTRSTRQGIQRKITERIDTQSIGSKVVSRELIPYCRERNIEFIAKRIKPLTQMYVFFENVNMTEYCVPKLIEIEMDNGVFQVGETIESSSVSVTNQSSVSESIRFRVAAPDHKYGPYNSPTLTYKENPYSSNVGLSSNYSATSSILNVDTASLSNIQENFKGRIKVGTKLIGLTSGAEATVTNLRLIADSAGTLIGSLYIPNPKHQTNPQFQSGARTIRVTANAANRTNPGEVTSAAEGKFTSAGQLDNKQETFISTRNANVEIVTLTDTKLESNTVLQTATRERQEIRQWVDPLAESFEIAEGEDCFVTSVDVFFKTKDPTIPVTLQIRTIQTGLPTSTILPFAEISLEPSQVNFSEDGSVPTNFRFKSPVFLKGGTSYAIVLISLSNSYEAWISRMGEVDISTASFNENERVIVSQQPYMGSLFKSQNGSTWDASQLEDLKFTIYRANFVNESGAFVCYNPTLSEANDKIVALRPNPIFTPAKEVVVGLGSTVPSSVLTSGVTITQLGNLSATGKLSRATGAIGIGSTTNGVYNLTVNNVGSGLTPSTGIYYYGNVSLNSVTGSGSGGLAIVEVIGGNIGIITVTNGGKGYSVGDVVSVQLGATSQNVRFNVGVITAINQLALTQVQGEFNTIGQLAYNAVGVASTLPSVPSSINIGSGDGQHIVVSHRNHGMHSPNNKVILSRVQGDYSNTKLSSTYSRTSRENILVEDISFLTTFENVGVSSTNPGYIIINDEIISYETTNGNNLVGIARGIDNSLIKTHPVGSVVSKYEFNGVSLRRINTTHELSSATISDAITLDGYAIKVGFSTNGVDRSIGNSGGFQPLFFNTSKIGGGGVAKATQNIQFEAITPNISTLVPTGTELSARVRTISATSVDGNEVSFVDQAFEPVQLGEINYFNTPRIIASQINETARLNTLPGNKSFTMEFIFSTENDRLSPVIDLQRLNIITTTNRLDNPVLDFASDRRVNANVGDPNSAIYVSKKVRLQTPAKSLQVRFAAYRHPSSEIRVLYKLFRADLPDADQPYLLFPGYTNLIKTGTNAETDYSIVDISKNNGLPNDFVEASSYSDQFYDYLYSQDNLPAFTGFMIKIVMTGTNQAYVPRIKDLRAIALA
jgi:hypothetical protein